MLRHVGWAVQLFSRGDWGYRNPDAPTEGVQDPLRLMGYRTRIHQRMGYGTQALRLMGSRTQTLSVMGDRAPYSSTWASGPQARLGGSPACGRPSTGVPDTWQQGKPKA